MVHATVINNGLQIFSSSIINGVHYCSDILEVGKNRMRAGNISKEISSAGNSNNPSLAISLRTE